MSYKSFLFAILVIVLAGGAIAQTRSAGTAVDVIDAKTVVVALPTGKVNVELRYIEVPDQDQPLYQTVRDHLRTLVVGKQVIFHLGGFVGSRMAGELYLNGIDIGRQMVRDGAAWHIYPVQSGQSAASAALYSEAEMLARNEKRGIWSVAGLKPPSVVREEKIAEEKRAAEAEKKRLAEAEKAAEKAVWDQRKPKVPPMQVTQQISNDAWLDVTGNPYNHTYGLHPYSGKEEGIPGIVITSPEFLYVFDGTSRQKIVCRAVYAYKEGEDGKEQSVAVLGFQGVTETLKLTKNKNSLSVIADGQRIPVSGLLGIYKHEYYGFDERFAYLISKKDFAKLANAKNVEIRIDNYKGSLDQRSLALFKQLSDVMQ